MSALGFPARPHGTYMTHIRALRSFPSFGYLASRTHGLTGWKPVRTGKMPALPGSTRITTS